MAIPNPLAVGLPNVNVVTIVQDTYPAYTFTGATGSAQMGAYTIPGGTVGPNDVIEVQILWTCNNSAGVKTLSANLPSNQIISDARTTAFGSLQTWLITPAMHSQGNQNQFQAIAPGALPSAPASIANDMTQDQYFSIWGNLAVSTDTMTVQFVSIRVWKDTTPQTTLLYQGQKRKLFYGMNGHFDYSQTPAQIVQSCKTVGVTVYRCTYEGNAASLAALVALAKAFQGTGITLYVNIDYSLQDPNAIWYPNEQAAYNATYGVAQMVAATLFPLGVTLFECGNELDTKNGINPAGSTGQFITDFTGTAPNGQLLFNLFRGCLRGAIDGVHSVSNMCLAGSNAFTVCGYGCMDGLWYGYGPDGTSGNLPARWDFTAYHNYRVYGSLLGMSGNFGTSSWVNVLEKLWRNYGMPIWISEFNGNNGDTDAQRAAYVSAEIAKYLAKRKIYGVQGCIIYSAYDSPYNVLTNPTTLVSTLGTTFASFIAANPDLGT